MGVVNLRAGQVANLPIHALFQVGQEYQSISTADEIGKLLGRAIRVNWPRYRGSDEPRCVSTRVLTHLGSHSRRENQKASSLRAGNEQHAVLQTAMPGFEIVVLV